MTRQLQEKKTQITSCRQENVNRKKIKYTILFIKLLNIKTSEVLVIKT